MFDRILTFCKVVSSSIGSQAPFTLYDVIGSSDESAQKQEVYQALGIIARPRAPETKAGKERFLESIAARIGDGLAQFGFRDERLHEQFPNPKPGTIAMVGYGGAFLAFDDTDDLTNVATLYVPYEFVDDIPQKAMLFNIDTDQKSISVVHGKGQALLLQDDGSFRAQSPDGQSFIQLENGRITMQAALTLLVSTVVVGNPATAAPLAASSTSTRLLISAV